ncbi:helix-turn-helix transcriptional regulator [Corynebacterium yonathiae]|uniref:Helix-turn-helix transcriptional regulator n=1 Tax=Corynebacterium yonathiae TaxID=2913504 RepID=A0ABU8Y2H6_9CORY
MSEVNGGSAPKKRGSDEAKAWAQERSEGFGFAVQFWRKKMELTAVELSNRTREIGYPITRATIAKIESNQRNSKMDFLEVCVLAAALEVTPSDLVFFGYPDKEVKITPRSSVTAAEASEWFFGGSLYNQFSDIHNPRLTQSQSRRQTFANFKQATESFEKKYKPEFSGRQWILAGDFSRTGEGKASGVVLTALRIHYKELRRLRLEHIEAGGYVDLPAWIDTTEVYPF